MPRSLPRGRPCQRRIPDRTQKSLVDLIRGPRRLPLARRGPVKLLSLGRARMRSVRSSSCGSNPANVGPHLERSRPCGAILAGGDVVAAEVEEVADLVVDGEEALYLPR